MKALSVLGVVATALACLQAVEAILGTVEATVMGTVALVLVFVVGGRLWDREADRRREDRYARPSIRRRDIIDLPTPRREEAPPVRPRESRRAGLMLPSELRLNGITRSGVEQ